MNFKIWTENDELVKNYNGFFSRFGSGTKSASIAMVAIYLYGGTYCELDFEYLHKDFYYNLYHNEPDTIYNCGGALCELWNNANYFFKKKNKIAKLSAELLYRFKDSDDITAVKDEHAYRLIGKEKLIEIKKKVKIAGYNINHYKGIRKNIKFCKVENFPGTAGMWAYDSINKYYILTKKMGGGKM